MSDEPKRDDQAPEVPGDAVPEGARRIAPPHVCAPGLHYDVSCTLVVDDSRRVVRVEPGPEVD